MKNKIKFTKAAFIDYLAITLGSAVMSLGIAMLVDVFIIPGGASGLSMGLYYVFNETLPIGLLKWIINIPLFIWGLKTLGNQFGIRTFWGFTSASIFLDLFRGSIPGLGFIRIQDTEVILDLVSNDFFFLVMVSAILMGVGLGMIFKYKGTTGGSDIPAAIFHQKYGIAPGKTIRYIDLIVIILAAMSFYFKDLPLERPLITLILYAVLLLFTESYIIDIMLNGFDYARMALIVTDKSNEVADNITKELSRGATAIKARGIYRNIDREIIMTVVTLKEVTLLNEIVKATDPDAFMITTTIHEITGHGFRRRV